MAEAVFSMVCRQWFISSLTGTKEMHLLRALCASVVNVRNHLAVTSG
ncbi:MAG: hypothetical protein ACP5OM_06755 [Methanothrix sp.]